MDKLWLVRFLVIVPVFSIILFPFIFGVSEVSVALGMLGTILYPICTILFPYVEETNSRYYVWQVWKVKPVYSKYGTFYLLPFGKNASKMVVTKLGICGLININAKAYSNKPYSNIIKFSGQFDDLFIDSVNDVIEDYQLLAKYKKSNKKKLNTWDGYLDKQVMRDKKLESIIEK